MSADYLNDAVKEALLVLNPNRVPMFALAIQMSTKVDLDYMDLHGKRFPDMNLDADPVVVDGRIQIPGVHTVTDIAEKTQFSRKDAVSFKIALTRPEAFKFVNGFTQFGEATFNKLFNEANYRKKFGKPPVTLGRNRLLLTYAEWIHFVGFVYTPDVPSALSSHLRRKGGKE